MELLPGSRKKCRTGITAVSAGFRYRGEACEKESLEEPNDQVAAGYVLEKQNGQQTGFDQWGFNTHAHQFIGYVVNAWFGDELDSNAPWYKKEPPFEGVAHDVGEPFFNAL